MSNIVVVIDGFQHGQSQFFVRRASFLCKSQNLRAEWSFRVSEPGIEAVTTYNHQYRAHGLWWGDDGEDQEDLPLLWREFLQKVHSNRGSAVKVYSKGQEACKRISKLLGCNVKDLGDVTTIGSVRGISHEEKVFYLAGAADCVIE